MFYLNQQNVHCVPSVLIWGLVHFTLFVGNQCCELCNWQRGCQLVLEIEIEPCAMFNAVRKVERNEYHTVTAQMW